MPRKSINIIAEEEVSVPMPSRRMFVMLVVVVAILVLGVWFGMSLPKFGGVGDSKYSAVYLSSGDVYFGEFDMFPRPHIENAWHLEKDSQGGLGITPMKAAFWAPGEDLYLNEKQIIFWAHLRSDSPVIKILTGQSQPQTLISGQSAENAAPAPKTNSSGTNTSTNQ